MIVSYLIILYNLLVGDILLDLLDELASRFDAGTDIGLGDLEEAIVVGLFAQGLHLRIERALVDSEAACSDIILVEADGGTLV